MDYASRAAKNSLAGCFCPAGRKAPGRSCSNPPAYVSLTFAQKKTASVSLHQRFFHGRGWITQAAHLKRPRRGLFAAGTYSGGRCCSNPPLRRFTNFQIKQKLQCHYNTGVLGGRGWITQAAHLKRPRRGLFAAGTYSGGRCCSNPPLRRFTNFQIKQKLQCHYNTGVLGGAKQPKSEPLPSGASLAAISSKVMVFVPSL